MNEKIKKYFFLLVGSIATALGIIGLFLPLMPTTCFLIAAVWAFSKSDPRLSQWILRHPQFGPAITHWMEHKAIDRSTKCKISLSIVVGFFLVITYIDTIICYQCFHAIRDVNVIGIYQYPSRTKSSRDRWPI